ncbi:MAG: site-specific integrase [Actinomycetota bacterium]|nr:site-specific integrase [Actinomycetota bacterium]
MAHVKKRGEKWLAVYIGADGREHSRTFAKSAEARRWGADQEAAVRRGDWLNPSLARMATGEWVTRWWAQTQDNRESTRERDKGYVNRYILPAFGDAPLGSLSHSMVQAWVAGLTERGLAPATVVKAFQILNKIAAAAVLDKRIATNPCAGVRLPKVEREEQRFLSPAEVARLADAIHPRYRALVLVGAWGGLRAGELVALRRASVDPLRRKVAVVETITEVSGRLVHRAGAKTNAGRRSVSLPAPIMAELVAHMERWSGAELVFTAPGGGPIRLASWRRRFWNPAVAAAGVEPFRVHDLRHTGAALAVASGAKPLEVARRLGHTSVSFCLDRYGHLFPEAEDEVADRLGALIVAPEADAEVVAIRKAE